MTLDPTPTISSEPRATRFTYDGHTYQVISCDVASQKILLERVDRLNKPGEQGEYGGALAEAKQVLVMEQDVEPRWYRCTLTEDFRENGRFLTAKYVKNAELKR